MHFKKKEEQQNYKINISARKSNKKETNIFEVDQKKNKQKNNLEMGTEKNSVLQAYLGQFRTDILTYKQYKDTKKNLDNNKKGKKSQQKREQRENLRKICIKEIC